MQSLLIFGLMICGCVLQSYSFRHFLSTRRLMNRNLLRSGTLVSSEISTTHNERNNNFPLDDEEKDFFHKMKNRLKPGCKIVIKYGGHAMENEELQQCFFADIALLYRELGIVPIIVHGGGPHIAKMLASLNVSTTFVDGLRVTDSATMETAQMVLCGLLNKNIANRISQQPGVKGAVGLSGLDTQLLLASQKDKRLGLVGEPTTVKTELLNLLVSEGYIPVIAPVGARLGNGESLNINADTAAGAIAQAVEADIFMLLTDIQGVLDKDKKLIETLPLSLVDSLVKDEIIRGGMIPKLETAVSAIKGGVGSVSIMDGRTKHCVLRALSGDKFGTTVCI